MSDSPTFSLNCPLPETDRDHVEMGHGSGGLLTHRLIEDIFRPAFAEAPEDLEHDGACIEIGGARIAFTTDSYVVRPLFFEGGDIGTLAVNGTVNDLAMCGARPIALSAGFVIEEGFPTSDLARIAQSMREAAQAAGVRLVTGDTKVVERGKGDGLYINSSGIGEVMTPQLVSPRRVRPGDAIVLSGDIGRHGMAVMAAREGLGFEPPIASDCAPLAACVAKLVEQGIDLHCLRDLTRGGLATALVEIAQTAGVAMRLEQAAIPVSEPVRGACEILGLDPLYVANEGRFAALVPAQEAERTLAVLREFDAAAAIIGTVAEGAGSVALQTLGGSYALDLMAGEQLPRIC
ncbi:hydrogenase expression/formation protein HypE [Novosphingobium mangrovi (ex Huang et al. 2023)]|uniref:Hydrogenase expression/formation protein HypE n=1 Tax=Novosphingobium mangrovi (ex Huang et al. 2023) TaxID=2976432 RepID=A0ABT2I0K8_9SPHN|nr:hydrogenase expression/formation protein HypE [Novosphingobium mangrovi (ex Huang et al. 2023)]MCT2398333.1 hydrogenase expression/formation protein HypE [Novosphingobium mangrovi (ex Huang et al. 2023)]